MGVRAAWRALWGAEQKQSAAGPLIAFRGAGQAVMMPRRIDKFADEGYVRNVIAHRAINEVARGVACVPWKLFRPSADDRAEVDGHPLLDLIDRPNPLQGRSEFFEAVVGFFLIAGNSYLEAVRLDGSSDGPKELWTLRPDRMSVVPNPVTGLPEAYEYRVAGQVTRWEADPVTGASLVRHLKTFHPLDDFMGLSPIEAAAFGIDQHNEAGKWNTALLQNGARPPGALVYDPKDSGDGSLTDEQFARLERQFAERHTGSANAGRPLILEGGLSWKEMGLSPKDMDFLNAKHTSARDIALAFGVPPQLLGIPGDNTYSNYQEARLALWEETIVPLLRHLRDELNGWLVPMFGEDLELDVDLDEVPALTLRRERKFEMIQKADFLTLEEKREALGFGEIDPSHTLLVPANMLPLGQEPEDEDPPPVGGIDEDEADARYRGAYGNPTKPKLVSQT